MLDPLVKKSAAFFLRLPQSPTRPRSGWFVATPPSPVRGDVPVARQGLAPRLPAPPFRRRADWDSLEHGEAAGGADEWPRLNGER